MISQSNMVFPAVVFTATGVTSAPIDLSPSQSGANGAYSSGAIAVRGTSLTTATFGVLGSSDGGQTYFPLNISSALVPGTVATTVTVTANGLYYVDLTAITHVQFVTSGTFTATSVAIQLTGSPNGDTGRSLGGGGGGGAVSSVFTRTGAVVAQTGDYSAAQISGLGTAATVNTGTSGATIPLLNAVNTWSALQTFSAGASIASASALNWNSDTFISRGVGAGLITVGTTVGGTNGIIQANQFAVTGSTVGIIGNASAGKIGIGTLAQVAFSSTTSLNGTADVGIDRSAAGVVEINNGTAGNSNGNLKSATLSTTATVPASATATGVAGTFIVGTDGFIYICTATNTWVRVQAVTW